MYKLFNHVIVGLDRGDCRLSFVKMEKSKDGMVRLNNYNITLYKIIQYFKYICDKCCYYSKFLFDSFKLDF